jgi:hypothetical protein
VVLPTDSTEQTWARVSFYDYCWIKLIAELRSFFIPIDLIKNIKANLFCLDQSLLRQFKQELTNFKNSRGNKVLADDLAWFKSQPESLQDSMFKIWNNFTLLMVHLLTSGRPASIVIDRKGISGLVILDENGVSESLQLNDFITQSCVSINLNGILDEFYINKRIKEKHFQTIFRLTEKETKVIALLRKEGVKEIRIRIEDKLKGAIMIEVIEKKNVTSMEAKIRNLLKKGDYKDIRIVSEDGRLKLFEEITKIKI